MVQKKDQCLNLEISEFGSQNTITMMHHSSIEAAKISLSGVKDRQAL